MNQTTNHPDAATQWHTLDAADALRRLDSSNHGLTDAEAKRRLERYGPNRLKPPSRRSAWKRMLAQFNNVLIYVLLVSAVVTALLEHWIDSGVIVAVVLVNALIGFVQEGKAERALEAIGKMLAPLATVVRHGQRQTIDAEQLVPGDIVAIQSGDKVPADLRLFRARELRVEEAALTGESMPVEKTIDPLEPDLVLGDRTCMAYSGTLVAHGQGMGVVVATGQATEIGRISGMLERVQPLTTRLLQKISQFGRWVSAGIVVLAGLTAVVGIVIHKSDATDMFIAAVGLAVAAIPEGLPAIITITLAIGVQRMARRNAIIRQLPAVETLGSVTVICSDKTGTLTRNEMTVRSIVTAEVEYDVRGVGYDPAGGCIIDERQSPIADHPIVTELVRGGALCNEANLSMTDGQWRLHGDPTEGALICLAMKASLDLATEREQYALLDTMPFESEHRYMATLHNHAQRGAMIYVKGAPERLFDRSQWQRGEAGDQPFDAERWKLAADRLAGRGERVLAIACKPADPGQRGVDHHHVAEGLTLLGLVGIADPPREEAIEAVRTCKAAGIRVKMITGDHAATARAIGKQMGIGDGTTVLTGQDLDTMTDEQLRQRVDTVDVFARVSPEHKLKLVELLQQNGHVVAMTGDGVNDAPALKRADIGVAMGVKGTDVAKEAAEMVLTDDNFASIAHAVEEGRTIYDNIRKAILFILPTNVAEAGIIVAAVVAGRTLPITPVQILWINMVTAVTLALALSFERTERGVMARPPRHPDTPILDPLLLWRVGFVGALLTAATFGLFIYERAQGASIELARTVAVNALVMFEVAYVINARHIRQSSLNRDILFENIHVFYAIGTVFILQFLFTYFAPMQKLFQTDAMNVRVWVHTIIIAAAIFFIIELEKWIMRRLSGRGRGAK